MKNTYKNMILIVLLFNTYLGFTQETLDANNPSTFVLGGGQQSQSASINLLPIAIIDVEPDPFGGGSGTGVVIGEAGLPVTGGTAADLDNLWINFSHRQENSTPARIFVSTNQPVPAGMTIKVEIQATGPGGGYGPTDTFPPNPRSGQVTIGMTEQIIVYDFGNGYTGDGVSNGYHIVYTIDNPGSVSLPAGFEVQYEIK
ncbi:hypothetical protein [Urechidicola croceus]|uniref:Uncharacterized protein n=1 Tax=Urechidicola croceus TaxID=1850246 RepID=A0A1D8P7E6_9FLAO|nr:hypothetical protein [Urechidicola croceus]AOW20489.1 hypothetical protein LPB138_07290 [Urechidicola croceus]